MTDPKKTFAKAPILSPEKIVPLQMYSITLNPNDKRQFFNCSDRIEKLTKFMEDLLLEVPNIDFVLHMEVSRTGRLHFHGTIKFNTKESIKHFFVIQIHDWLEVLHIDIDNLLDPVIWTTYCTKSRHLIDVVVSTKDVLQKYRKVKVDKNGVMHKPFF